MKRVKEIMEMFGISKEDAHKVLDEMQVDFSECTLREFRYAARAAHKSLAFSKLQWTTGRDCAAVSACGRFYITTKPFGVFVLYDTKNRLAGGCSCTSMEDAKLLAERIAA